MSPDEDHDDLPPGRLQWPVVDPPDCPPCTPRYSIGMLFPASAPWASPRPPETEPTPPNQEPDDGSAP